MNTVPKIDMADMPVQLPTSPDGPAAARARFFNSGNAFNIKLPPVPAARFHCPVDPTAVPQATGYSACDQSSALATAMPATTPLMLARYATIAPGSRLAAPRSASGVIWYVIAGSGVLTTTDERFAFGTGDVFTTAGSIATTLDAAGEGAVLWLVGNDPLLAFDGLAPDPAATAQAVHYPATEIAAQLQRVVAASQNATTSGMALIFSNTACEAARNILPMLTLSLNTVPPGQHQRAHRHNSAAITLTLSGEGCYSMVAGKRCDWSPFATMVTPPGEPHSHHNDSGERAVFLIVQDGGLHYHARTMGFEFLEQLEPADPAA